jgi:predicted AlkP superfamily pyrophosphatase or phosphodiesterase
LFYLRNISIFYVFNICIVFLFHFLIGDLLFFLSDYYSIFVYVGIISFLLLFFETYFIFKNKTFLINLFTQVIILFFFIYYFATYFFDLILLSLRNLFYIFKDFLQNDLDINEDIISILKSFKIYVEYFIILLFLSILILLIIKLFKNRKNISFKLFDTKRKNRTEIFAVIVFLLINSLILWHYVSYDNSRQINGSKKNIVVIVLDALSADLLRDYGGTQTYINFNKKYNASIYKNFRTIYPHTAHFFKFFYSGSPNVDSFSNSLQQKKINLKKIENDNLIKSLQENGVLARTHVYHRSAVPEGTDYGINDYKGLRSFYLTDNLEFIPKLMNLDYHLINSTSNSISKKLKYNFQSYFRKLFVKNKINNDLEDILLPELINLSNQKKPFFLIFHQRWNNVSKQSDFKNYYDPDEDFDKKDQSYCRKANKILKKQDMTYDKIFEAKCLDLINKKKIAAAQSLEKAIDEFIAEVKQNNLLKDVEIIITADHGYMTAKNKLSYGFHNDELVVKVPLIIFNNKKEINSSNFFTLDLVSYILSNYGLDSKKLYKYAVPLTSEKREFPTYTISRPGKFYKRWMLSYYLDNQKFEINLHKKGKGEFNYYTIENFEQNIENKKINNENIRNFKIILNLLGISSDSINPKILN